MTKAAGGIVDVADIPAVGVPLDIVTNSGGGYTGTATAALFIGGTHVVLTGTITRPVSGGVGLQRAVNIGTLPSGLRPTQTRRVSCAMGNATPTGDQAGLSAIQIATDGTMILTASSATINPQSTVYLDSVMFPI